MSTTQLLDRRRSTKRVEGPVAHRLAAGWHASCEDPVALPPKVRTALVTKVRCLEARLFAGNGELRRGISRDEATAGVVKLNELRSALGWLLIDTEGHWRWPD